MADRPIPFSAPMVRALLREVQEPGTGKTMTRRVLSPRTADFGSAPREYWQHADFGAATVDGGKPIWSPDYQYLHVPCHNDPESYYGVAHVACERCDEMGWEGTRHRLYPKSRPGTRLWVREAWRTLHKFDDMAPRHLPDDRSKITYEADPENRNPLWAFGRLRAGMHLPRWASRLTLVVTEVKVERLRDISKKDARAEGLEWVSPTYGVRGLADSWDSDPRNSFRALWNSIHGPDAWDANPWVAAVRFQPFLCNIDAMEDSRVAA